MNEVLLNPEEQVEAVNTAIRILRERVLGGISSIHITDIDEAFLALTSADAHTQFPSIRPNDSQETRIEKAEQGPKYLDVLSVSRALGESVRIIIARDRSHIEAPYLPAGMEQILGRKIIKILEQQQGKNIKVPARIAASIESNVERIQQEIDTLEMDVEGHLSLYTPDMSPEDKIAHWKLTQNKLLESEGKKQEIERIKDLYDLSALEPDTDNISASNSGWQEQEEDDDEDDFGGGIGLLDRDDESESPDDILFFEENIPLSHSEMHLRGYLSPLLRDSEGIFTDTFTWHAEGEEWQRESFHISDFPNRRLEMLNTMLCRKKIIALHAEVLLMTEEAKRQKMKKKFGGPGLGKIKKYLPELLEEIQALEGKISSLLGSTDEDSPQDETTLALQRIKSLEGNISFLLDSLDGHLIAYIGFPGTRGNIREEIMKTMRTLEDNYKDLKHVCKKSNIDSDALGEISGVSVESPESCLTLTEYTQNPDFFEEFPDVLSTQKTPSERFLFESIKIDIPEWMKVCFSHENIEINYVEPDDTSSNKLQKMEIIEEILALIIRRKMFMYYSTQEQTQNHTQETPLHLAQLKQEIDELQQALTTLQNRIQWEQHDTGVGEHPELDKSHDLHGEIESISQIRFHYLQAFAAAQTAIDQALIGQKIMQYCQTLESRRKLFEKLSNKDREPKATISIEGLSYVESRALRYTLPDIRKSESELFQASVALFDVGEGDRSTTANDVSRLRASILSERKMLLYFFLINRKTEIDTELRLLGSDTSELEKLVTERDEIESHEKTLLAEIGHHLEILTRITQPLTSRKIKRFRYQELYDEAMKVLGELDGKLAHVIENEHESMYKEYWSRIQRHVRRFMNRVEIEEVKGNFHLIPEIQQEYNTEMRCIIHDIEIFLESITKETKQPENLKHYIRQVQDRLFGGHA